MHSLVLSQGFSLLIYLPMGLFVLLVFRWEITYVSDIFIEFINHNLPL
jgi:hypothetical protein